MLRVKDTVLAAISSAESHIDVMLALKVLIALVSRNAIRLSREDFLKLIPAFEQLFDMRGQRLSDLLFYSTLIIVSLLDDYSIMLSVQSALSKMELTPEGKRLLYTATAYQTEKLWKELLQEICDTFEFPINMPETYLAQSCEKLMEWRHGQSLLSVGEMDDKCLIIYIRGGGTDVSWQQFTASLVTSSNLHFCALLDCVVSILRLRVLEQELLRLLETSPDLSHRVLLYILTYNSYPDVMKYPQNLLFRVDVRSAIFRASGVLKERLLVLIVEQLPYYFLPRFVAFEGLKCPSKSDLTAGWLQKPETIRAQDLDRWKAALHWSPLKTLLETLDALVPESSKQEFELLSPLRVFKAKLFMTGLSADLALSLLEVSIAVWEHYVSTYQSPVDGQTRSSFTLLMVFANQQSACAQHLIESLGVSEAIDKQICEFLHCFWIENPLLIRLVHVQGYPSTHLETMVQQVDSLICTWDFIEELLKDGPQEKQVFALLLSGYMAIKYPTQRMLDVLRTCLQFLEDNGRTFWDVAPVEAVLEMYLKTFSQLSGRIKDVRKKLRRPVFSYTPDLLAMVR